MFLSRMATIGWGIALFGLAIVVRQSGGKVLEIGLSIASVAYGSLLGVFMLGVLTRRTSESGAMVGMLCGFILNVFLWQFTKVPYTWYVPLGSIVTFSVGYCASFFLRRTMPVESVSEVRT
jgi:Na+/proline symporter